VFTQNTEVRRDQIVQNKSYAGNIFIKIILLKQNEAFHTHIQVIFR